MRVARPVLISLLFVVVIQGQRLNREFGKWRISSTVTEMTSDKRSHLELKSEDGKAMLIVTGLPDKSGIVVITTGIVDRDQIRIRFDNEEAFDTWWNPADEHGVHVRYVAQGENIVTKLSKMSTLRIEYHDLRSETTVLRFDVRGFSKAFARYKRVAEGNAK